MKKSITLSGIIIVGLIGLIGLLLFALGPRHYYWTANSAIYEDRYYVKVYSVDYGGTASLCSKEISIPVYGVVRLGCGGIQMFADLIDKKGFLGLFSTYTPISNIPEDVPGGPEFSPQEVIEGIVIKDGEIYWYGEKILTNNLLHQTLTN